MRSSYSARGTCAVDAEGEVLDVLVQTRRKQAGADAAGIGGAGLQTNWPGCTPPRWPVFAPSLTSLRSKALAEEAYNKIELAYESLSNAGDVRKPVLWPSRQMHRGVLGAVCADSRPHQSSWWLVNRAFDLLDLFQMR
jgi:hypothetical protein